MNRFIENCKNNLGTLKLEYELPELFVKSEYDSSRGPSIWYVIYRFIWCVDHLFWVLYAFFSVGEDLSGAFPWNEKGYFFIYLTCWGIMLQAVDSTLQFVLVLKEFLRMRKGGGVIFMMPMSYKVSWAIENINIGIAPLITLVYWTCLHKKGAGAGSALNFHEHMMNGIYILINLWVTARPIQLIHFLYVLGFGLFYIFFSLMYYAGGGCNNYDWKRYVYPILDWSKPGSAILMVFIAFVVIVLVYLAAFGIHKLRIWCHEKVSGERIKRQTLKDNSPHSTMTPQNP